MRQSTRIYQTRLTSLAVTIRNAQGLYNGTPRGASHKASDLDHKNEKITDPHHDLAPENPYKLTTIDRDQGHLTTVPPDIQKDDIMVSYGLIMWGACHFYIGPSIFAI